MSDQYPVLVCRVYLFSQRVTQRLSFYNYNIEHVKYGTTYRIQVNGINCCISGIFIILRFYSELWDAANLASIVRE